MSKKLIGFPCVGGKSRLVEDLSRIVEEQADKGNVTEVYDLCGGGGKIILSLDRKKFKRLGYNEYEYGVATLMAMLKERDNISIINNKVQFILDKVLTLGDAADKESIHRALFQVGISKMNMRTMRMSAIVIIFPKAHFIICSIKVKTKRSRCTI